VVVADGLSRQEERSASIRVVIRYIRMKQLPLQCQSSPGAWNAWDETAERRNVECGGIGRLGRAVGRD
jgi:hypothetical protein